MIPLVRSSKCTNPIWIDDGEPRHPCDSGTGHVRFVTFRPLSLGIQGRKYLAGVKQLCEILLSRNNNCFTSNS